MLITVKIMRVSTVPPAILYRIKDSTFVTASLAIMASYVNMVKKLQFNLNH